MPVQLSIEDQNSPQIITLEEYHLGRLHFDTHYFHTAAALPFGGQDFSVLWDDLNNAVNQFATNASVPLNTVALRFVHCYDVINNHLYLRLQICTLEPVPITRAGHDFYPLNTSVCDWYEIKQGSFMLTQNHLLEGVEYFEHFYYEIPGSGGTMQKLADGGGDTYVRNLVFPWEAEILQMYNDNNNPENAYINFGACSYVESIPGTESVMWPHGLVMYLSDSSGHKMLDNENYISLFHNKGADYGTQCPPLCDGYLNPNS